MNISNSRSVKITEIYEYLKEKSFKSFISWKGRTCIVSDLELFGSLVISALMPGCTLKSFLSLLEEVDVKCCVSSTILQITIPKKSQKLRNRSRSSNPIIKHLDEIEMKQERLCVLILRAQEKLERALKINKQIKIELKKSEDFQKNFWELQCKEIDMEKELVESCCS